MIRHLWERAGVRFEVFVNRHTVLALSILAVLVYVSAVAINHFFPTK